MIRTRRADVSISVIRLRRYIDDNGNSNVERRAFTQSIGSLNGLDLIAPGSYLAIYDAINDIARAFQSANDLGPQPKTKEVNSLVGRLNQYDRILMEGARLMGMEDTFNNNNFLPLCFLVPDPAERTAAAKIAMRSAGNTGSHGKADAWLAYQETKIKERLGVDELNIL